MSEDSRKKLIDAASLLFAESGYDGVSIRQISEAAEVNSAMISYHFGSKKALYEAVLDRQLDPIRQLTAQDYSDQDPREVIRLYAGQMLHIHQTHPELLSYIFRELAAPSAVPHGLFQTIAPPLFRLLTGALSRGVRLRLFREDLDIPAAALLLAGMVNFHFLSRYPRRKIDVHPLRQLEENLYLKQAVDVFLRGIQR